MKSNHSDPEVLCYRIHAHSQKGRLTRIPVSSLTPGDMQIQVKYSSVNYKDALAGLAVSPILKKYPLNGGVDCAGIVLSSSSSAFQKGQEVLLHGCHLSELNDGGYCQQVNAHCDDVIHKPKDLTLKESMIIGTAGFTAALCLFRMLKNAQEVNKGPILITGATGGVGCLAIDLFSHLGYEVWAMTGKKDKHNFLKSLGATKVFDFKDLPLKKRPLGQGLFGGVIDNVGGKVLEGLLPHIMPWGNIASVGLALSPSFATTVMPFILRGVSLLGISSNNCSLADRQAIWQNIGRKWKFHHLKEILTEEITLEDLNFVFQKMLNRETYGRIIVKIGE